MWIVWIWIVSIIATKYLAEQKKLRVRGFFLLSIFTWPLAASIVLLLPAKKNHQSDSIHGVINFQDTKRQLQDIQFSLSALEQKTKNLEQLIARLSNVGADMPVID